jgi:hypothetical protein
MKNSRRKYNAAVVRRVKTDAQEVMEMVEELGQDSEDSIEQLGAYHVVSKDVSRAGGAARR